MVFFYNIERLPFIEGKDICQLSGLGGAFVEDAGDN